MIVYRITTLKRAGDLSGTGAKLYGGRWNSAGNPVVYAAQTISLAMLETLVHANRSLLQREYAVCEISVPDSLGVMEFQQHELPKNWRDFPFHHSTTNLGDQWIQEAKTTILKVPSAVNSFEHNFLLNPQSPGFQQVKIAEIRALSFDFRLL